MDTSLSARERAESLLDASSQHQIYRWLAEQPANSPDRTEWNPSNVGDGHPADADPVIYPAQIECTPDVVYVNGPEGLHNTAGSTAWPAPIAVAATWNQELAVDKGAATADEAFDKGKNVILGPGINSARTPLSGRNSEYFGEDAVLSGLLAAASVTGIEDENDPTKPVFSNVKHYLANEQETDRESSSSNIDVRTLREIYSLPFEIAIERSDPGSVMCSYNQINDVYACENPILNTILKDDAGFNGYVMSDFGSVHSTAASLNAGLDQELNRPIWFTPARLDDALSAGKITQQRIEAAAMRVVETYIREGLFDYELPAEPVADVSTPDHKALARTIAEQSAVLLKNDGVLPFDTADVGSIGVFGATASAAEAEGANAADACASFIPFGGGFPTLNCEEIVAPDVAITERASVDGVSVTFNDGTDSATVATDAANVDVAVVFGHYAMGEFSDIDDIQLDHGGDALIAEVAANNPNTIVVLQTGGPVEMPWIDDVSAVYEAWYAGEQVGPAIAGLLFGDVSPSGKLPVSFPVSLSDTPAAQTDYRFPGVVDTNGIRQVDYTEGLSVGYRWYEEQGIAPLFPFGHGLTYGEFAYSDLDVEPMIHSADSSIDVSFVVTNTGDATAMETAQVYIELPASANEPSKRLAGWSQVELDPGQSEEVTVQFDEDDLEDLHLLDYFDEDADQWVTAAGNFSIHVGGSFDTVLEAPLEVPFVDVSETGSEFYDEIMWLVDRGITTGWQVDGSFEFRPFSSITRDAMAAFLYRYAGSPEVTVPAESPFVDADESLEHYEAIVWLAQEGISEGWETSSGKEFRPFEPITRDAMAAFLYRMADEPSWEAPATSPFTDITSTNTEFYNEITWLEDTGITQGWQTSTGTEFRPFNKTTRDAMAAFLFRYDNLPS